MGEVGRPRVPTVLKVIKGTDRPCRRNPDEPKPKAGIPRPPDFLQGDARKHYWKTARKLARLGLVTEIDGIGLAMLCQEWAHYVEATESVKASGLLIKSPNGFPVLNPYLIVANQAQKKLRSLLSDFGMSPGSRSRIQAAAADVEDPADEWKQLLK